MKKVYIGIAIALLMGMNGVAQTRDKAVIRQVMLKSQDAVNAVAMYPRETRKIIFTASEYPQVILKLNAMQHDSQGAFTTLISTYSKKEQEKIWNLTRYDNLIADLSANPGKSKKEINVLLDNYPAEIHKSALSEYKTNFDLLVEIDQMNVTYDTNFKILMDDYSPEVQNVFREMVNMPEVLDILNDNMEYTRIVGDSFKKDPDWILHKTDSLNLVLNQKNTKEANDWKQSLNDDPEAQKEYVQAAQEYAQYNGYQPSDYNTPMTEFDTNYTPNPYTWWFGYPSWYPDNSWNPNPYWYDWGFYYGPGKQIVYTGLPSSYFMDWYFFYPEHHKRYAELSNHYYNYYDKHVASANNNSVSRSVNEWRGRNKEIITSDWDKDKRNRVERFKQFGQLEVDRGKYNSRNPKKQIGQADFAQKQPNRYYFLADDVSKRPSVQRDPKPRIDPENMPKPAKRPNIATQGRFKPSPQPEYVNPQPANTETRQRPSNVNIPPRNTTPARQPENTIQMREAQQYHQNTWKQQEQPRPQQPQQTRQPQPSRQAEPQQQPRQQPQQQAQPQQNRQPEVRQSVQPARQNGQTPVTKKDRQ